MGLGYTGATQANTDLVSQWRHELANRADLHIKRTGPEFRAKANAAKKARKQAVAADIAKFKKEQASANYLSGGRFGASNEINDKGSSTEHINVKQVNKWKRSTKTGKKSKKGKGKALN